MPRWEKFAPGPVRSVTVSKGGDPGEPKRRGRPPKRKDDSHHAEPEVPEVKPLEGDQVFGPRSKKRSTVVPPPVEETMSPVAPRTIDFGAGDTQPWATRATFAGRKKPDNPEAAGVFEARRSKFYGSVPSHFWKDGLERLFWNKCVASDSMDVAMDEFLKDQGVVPSSSQETSRKGRGRGGAKAKDNSKTKSKEPGRHRGRGRGRGKGAKD